MAMKEVGTDMGHSLYNFNHEISIEEAQFFTFNSEQLPRHYTMEFSCTV